MDNQHKLIKGYRDLSNAEINLMNEVKAKALEVGTLVHKITCILNEQFANEHAMTDAAYDADPFNWLQRGKDDLQDGFMKLVRSIAQPTTF